MPILPIFGHEELRERLRSAAARGSLPSSLLFHGPRGVGKQRLGLWLGQLLLCTAASEKRPCGECQSCRYALELAHPDLLWFFPRPRLKESDPDVDDVRSDFVDALLERVKRRGLHEPSSGTEALYVATIRAIVRLASMNPALGRRKVFIIGDAERMVPQEGADMAANAFLKLLEEPPADTTLVLTSSEPGALLPTIRSRVVSIRVRRLSDRDVEAFLAHPGVEEALESEDLPKTRAARVRLASGAPGALLSGATRESANAAAKDLLAAAASPRRADRYQAALSQGSNRARGAFSETLNSLTALLHERAAQALQQDDTERSLAAAAGVDAVERTKELTATNVNPQLLAARLLADLDGGRR